MRYMDKRHGTQIGSAIGRVLDVDVDMNDTGWENYLRVRIEIPLNKTLARGRFITIKDESFWIPFKYEKLPRICYNCGKIFHDTECKSDGTSNSNQYGSWLRVEGRRRTEITYGRDRTTTGQTDSTKHHPIPQEAP